MTWNCPVCSEKLSEYNRYCEYCYQLSNIKVFNPDKYFISDIKIYHVEQETLKLMTDNNEHNGKHRSELSGEELLAAIEADDRMTPQEKAHARFFYHETILVSGMDNLTLDAHIEELSSFVFEGRSRHGAAVNEKERRKKLKTHSGVHGFERSVNVDEASTAALNTVKERQKKLTAKEKVAKGLAQLYATAGLEISEEEKQKIMSATNILTEAKKKDETSNILHGPLRSSSFTMTKPETSKKTFINPFEKKK